MLLRYYVGKVFHSWTTKLGIPSENFVMLSYMLNHNFGIKLILHGTTYSCNLARTILNKDTANKFSQHAATTKIMSASGRQKLYGVTSL